MLSAALVAPGLGCLSLGDCHERPQSVAEHAPGGSQMGHFRRSQHRSSERELPCRLDRIQEGAVVRDDDERAVVAAERLLELFNGLQVEVVGGLVEHEQVHLTCLQLGQVRPRALTR